MTNSKSGEQSIPETIPTFSGPIPDNSDACCKVKRVANAYRLTGLDQELQYRYEDRDDTLHDLSDYVNNRITAVLLSRLEEPPSAEPSTIRAALEGEETVPATRRDDLRATLAGQLELDALTDAYVSHETVRKHLNEHLDVSTSRGGFETFEEFEEALDAYARQYENAVRSALERAGRKGLIDGKEYRVFSTRVECENCSKTYRLGELIEQGGCECSDD